VSIDTTDPDAVRVARVQVGIDAAVVADHHVTIRETTGDGQVRLSRFHTPPTITGLTRLGERLASYPQVLAVAEPTSMTWLGLHVALREAGCDLALVGTRHAARLRGAISARTSPTSSTRTCWPWPVTCSTWPRCARLPRRSWRCVGRWSGVASLSSTATVPDAG